MRKLTAILVLFFGWVSASIANVAVMGAIASANGAAAANSNRGSCIIYTSEELTKEQINQMCGYGTFNYSGLLFVALAALAIIAISSTVSYFYLKKK